mgnify:CR=1 FL=1
MISTSFGNKTKATSFVSFHLCIMTTTTYIKNPQQMWNLRKWSHHFSTLSEYPIISCCVKTIGTVNQGEEATKTMLKGVQQHEEHSLYGPHWIQLDDAATEHICYLVVFSRPFSAYSLFSCYWKKKWVWTVGRWVWIFAPNETFYGDFTTVVHIHIVTMETRKLGRSDDLCSFGPLKSFRYVRVCWCATAATR